MTVWPRAGNPEMRCAERNGAPYQFPGRWKGKCHSLLKTLQLNIVEVGFVFDSVDEMIKNIAYNVNVTCLVPNKNPLVQNKNEMLNYDAIARDVS